MSQFSCVTQVTEHIFRIPVPLPDNPLKTLNSYLVRDGSQSLLIDTGFRLDACREALLRGLAELGQDPGDMDIFLTHLHADHAGLAPELVGPGHTIYVSETDCPTLSDSAALEAHWRANTALLRRGGLPESIVSVMEATNPAIAYAAAPQRSKYTPVRDGHTFSIAGLALRCIHTPGHAPGHMCLWDAETGILFTGDHVLFDITPNITAWPFTEDSLGDYLRSLEEISRLPVRLALPAHRAGGDFAARVSALQEHHRLRLEEVVSILRSHPRSTAYEVAGRMSWSIRAASWEDFPAAQKIFALGECLSHLDHLRLKGLVCTEEDGGLLLYSI